jgi:hypothetical protein
MTGKTKEILVHAAVGAAAVAASTLVRFFPQVKDTVVQIGTEAFKIAQGATAALSPQGEKNE